MGCVGLSVFCVAVSLLGLSLADITVQKFENQTAYHIAEFSDMPAWDWGAPLGDKGIVGQFAAANPENGCGAQIQKSPRFSCFALIRRGGCNFDHKALNAQRAGFQAAVIYNDRSNDIFKMRGGPSSRLVNIPAVFIGRDDGLIINSTFVYTVDENVTIIIDGRTEGFNILDRYVWPFLGSVVFVFLLLAAFTVYKWSVDRRRRRRNRLSVRKLSKIPLKKFAKGDPYDVCAICLDEYEEQDDLRILPCNHAYHAKCIDPWLTKAKRQCPVCKRKVSPGSDNSSRASVPTQAENANIVEHTPVSETPVEDNANTTEEELEDEVEASVEEAPGESTPLLLRSENEEVEIRDRSLFSRLRDAWNSWGERRRRNSSRVIPTPDDHEQAARSFGYGSLSEVPTEFNPTLPPPPARSLQPRSSVEDTRASVDENLTGNRMRTVRPHSDESDDDLPPVEHHSATLHTTPNATLENVKPTA